MTTEVKSVKEGNREGFVIRLNSKDDSMRVSREKKRKIFAKCAELFKGKNKGSRMSFYPYRKSVKIDKEKFESDNLSVLKFFNTHSQFAYDTLYREIQKGCRIDDLSTLHLYEENLYTRPVLNIIDDVFEANNGTINGILESGETVGITYTSFKEYLKINTLKRDIRDFKALLQNMIYTEHLPVNNYTKKYIRFDKGMSLITLRLDTTLDNRRSLTDVLLALFISSMYDGGYEIVNMQGCKLYANISVLVENKDANDVLERFVKLYQSYTIKAYYRDYNLDVQVESNIGHEKYQKECFYILSGEHYESLKDSFTLEEETYLGFPSYK